MLEPKTTYAKQPKSLTNLSPTLTVMVCPGVEAYGPSRLKAVTLP